MTQSSMHLPPLRHGRRARHTEAVDTGRSKPSLPSPYPKGPSLRNAPTVSFPGLPRVPSASAVGACLRVLLTFRSPSWDSGFPSVRHTHSTIF